MLFNFIGTQGAIRREAHMPVAFHWAMSWLLFFALCIGITQLVFVYNFIKTLHRKPAKENEHLHKNSTGREGIVLSNYSNSRWCSALR